MHLQTALKLCSRLLHCMHYDGPKIQRNSLNLCDGQYGQLDIIVRIFYVVYFCKLDVSAAVKIADSSHNSWHHLGSICHSFDSLEIFSRSSLMALR